MIINRPFFSYCHPYSFVSFDFTLRVFIFILAAVNINFLIFLVLVTFLVTNARFIYSFAAVLSYCFSVTSRCEIFIRFNFLGFCILVKFNRELPDITLPLKLIYVSYLNQFLLFIFNDRLPML